MAYLPRTGFEMFQYTLQKLQNEETVSISPDEFHVLLNPGLVKYINERAELYENNQKDVDDLRNIISFKELSNQGKDEAGKETFNLPVETKTPHGYMRLLNIRVKPHFQDSKCFADGLSDTYYRAHKSDADTETVRKHNPYRRATVDGPEPKIYYDIIGNEIKRFDTGGNTFIKQVEIKFFIYPKEMTVDSNSVSELSIEANIAVCDRIVTEYLDIIKDERYPQNIREIEKEQIRNS